MLRRTVLAAFLAISTLPAAGCAKGGGLEGVGAVLQQFLPKITFKKLAVTDVDFEGIETNFVFNINNPNPIKVKLASFSYALDLGGKEFLSGDQADGLELEARGDSALVFPVATRFADVISLVGGTKGQDDVPFAFRGNIGFDTPLGEIKVPFQESGRFPVLKAPKIAFGGVRVGKVNLLNQSATLTVDLNVSHKQGSPLTFDDFDYALSIGSSQVIDGKIATLGEVAAGSTQTVSLPVTVNLLQVGSTIVSAITNKSGKMPVTLDARLKVGTPLGAIPFRIDETGKVRVE